MGDLSLAAKTASLLGSVSLFRRSVHRFDFQMGAIKDTAGSDT